MAIKTLVIEDDPIWQDRLLKSLPADQFDTTLAPDVAAAVIILKSSQFDLVCLDLVLPDSAATATLQTITSTVRHTPIVITTTIEDKWAMQLAMSLGIEDFIIKNKFTADVFIHASLLSIQRISAKIIAEFSKNLEFILANLQALEQTLISFTENPK